MNSHVKHIISVKSVPLNIQNVPYDTCNMFIKDKRSQAYK